MMEPVVLLAHALFCGEENLPSGRLAFILTQVAGHHGLGRIEFLKKCQGRLSEAEDHATLPGPNNKA